MGTISSRSVDGSVIRLTIEKNGWGHDPERGDSIAINGCCLTVVDKTTDRLEFDMVRTTTDTTTLASLEVGTRVNLEHAATPATLLGGHLVQQRALAQRGARQEEQPHARHHVHHHWNN